MNSPSVSNNKDVKKYAATTSLSALGGAFNYLVFMVGTALVATPFQFSLTTPYIGIITDICIGIWCYCAALCMFNSSVIVNATSFIDIGRKTFGNTTYGQKCLNALFVAIPSIIMQIGALAAYITIASAAVSSYISMNSTIIEIAFTVAIFILGCIKSFDATKYVSTFTFIMVVYIVFSLNYTSITLYGEIEHTQQRQFNFLDYIQAIPILAFGLNAHVTLSGMAGEMVPKVQRVFPKYLFFSQFLVVIFNSSLGFTPSLIFGECTQSDSMIQMHCMWEMVFQGYSVLIIIAQIFLGIALVVQAPLFVIPVKELFLDFGGKAVRDRSIFVNVISSFFIAAVSGVLGIMLGNITDTLNVAGTIGSLMVLGPTSAIFSLKHETGTFARFRAWFIMTLGCIFICVNIYTIVVTFTSSPRDEGLDCLCDQ